MDSMKWDVLAPYWEGLAKGELRFPRCSSCGRFQWYPAPLCPCGDTAFEWRAVSPLGRVYTSTVIRHAFLPEFADRLPLLVLLVDIDEAPGVRLVTGLLDTSVKEIEIGAAVRLVPEPVSEHAFLPFAVPVGKEPA
jgi:hypothetical protein